jgi:hypothetical protein
MAIENHGYLRSVIRDSLAIGDWRVMIYCRLGDWRECGDWVEFSSDSEPV